MAPVKKSSASSVMSMTGFGRATLLHGSVSIEVEIKAVNHRFLDVSLRLPRPYTSLEGEIRALISGKLERGRIEVILTRSHTASGRTLRFDEELFVSLRKIYLKSSSMKGKLSPELELSLVSQILNRHEVLGFEDTDVVESAELRKVELAVASACDELSLMRKREGERLGRDIQSRLQKLATFHKEIEKKREGLREALTSKLRARIESVLKETGGSLDESRLASEVVFYADRLDVTEELVRLSSHLSQFKDTLLQPSTGRKLDFLLQEIGREFNTIGSKAQHAHIQSLVVEAKVEMERIREQLQNIA